MKLFHRPGIKIAAFFTLLPISIIFIDTARAQAPDAERRGFSPPGTAFGTSPFGAPKPSNSPPKGSDFDDEFDDEDDSEINAIGKEIMEQKKMEMEQRPHGTANNGGARSGGSPFGSAGGRARPAPSVDFGAESAAIGNTSTAGGASSKIQPGQNGPACLKLDPVTGYGPDIVTNFDFPDADIVEIAKTLGRLTCLNFILDKDVKGRISIVSNSPIKVGDAWKAFLTALDVNGFSIIPSGKYLRIARQREVKDKQIKTFAGDFSPNTDAYITRVLPLKYIGAEEVARVFRNFMPPNTRIISYEQTNTLIITDTGSNVQKIVDMVKLLDVEGFDEGLEVIRIKYASAQDISKLIDQLLPGGAGAQGSPAGAPPGFPRFRGGGFTPRKTKEGGIISHIIPDDRTNSVIVSANAKGLEQVKELITKLDAKVAATAGGSKLHVVYLQFADAEQVATTLNNLAANAGAKSPTPGSAAQPPGSSTTAALFEGAIKISADKATNSLVITGTPSDFQTIGRVIAKLDVPRDQVYVEAVIMEMSLDKKFELGTNIAAPNAGVSFTPDGTQFANFLMNPLAIPGLALNFKSGNSQNITIPGTNNTIAVSSIQGLVKALQTNTNSNVLATPQILTLDNQDASIEIGDNVPIATQSTIQGAGISVTPTYQKVALTLKIKPQINKISNFVKLDIDQKLDDITGDVQIGTGLAPKTTTRASKTTVIVQDGDTVAMGGLIRNKVTETTTKVPLLGDIPLLGWLFRSSSTTKSKLNLLVFITPQIIKQYQNIRKIVDRKIRQRDEFLEKTNGGEDPFQDYKMEMIKNLPPVSELKSGGRVESSTLDGSEEPEADGEPAAKIPSPQTNNDARRKAMPPNGLTPPAGTQPPIDGATAPGVIQKFSPNSGATPIPPPMPTPSLTPPPNNGAKP